MMSVSQYQGLVTVLLLVILLVLVLDWFNDLGE